MLQKITGFAAQFIAEQTFMFFSELTVGAATAYALNVAVEHLQFISVSKVYALFFLFFHICSIRIQKWLADYKW